LEMAKVDIMLNHLCILTAPMEGKNWQHMSGHSYKG
jgi:hypothetical protein